MTKFDHGLSNREHTKTFERILVQHGFTGVVRSNRATKVVYATDNSIYYREPSCVVEPKSAADVSIAVKAAAETGLSITPRGGGTGTNGQSLTSGIVIDTSRFMNTILEFNLEKGVIRLEPGVVLDQLNSFLKPHDMFFPPAVSTASRATLGGMVATDASGKGSRRYGRTSDYLISADVVFSDGSTGPIADLPAKAPQPDGLLGTVADILRTELPELDDQIAETFPVMNRGLTGYNLDQLRGRDGALCLTKLLAGSEGTLAIITAIELRIVPLPRFKGTAVIGYPDSIAALGAVAGLLPFDPEAIEFLDDLTVNLGKSTPVWPAISSFLGGDMSACGGYLFAEFFGDTPEKIDVRLTALRDAVNATPGLAIGIATSIDPSINFALDALRKDAVGLMGKGEGPLKGIAFVEDAAVPPENLIGFVRGFRAILDSYGLKYGMYGHADVGCVHVRPLMDMRLPEHRSKIRPISDAVAELANANGGLIWGEHGKGVRGEYVEQTFGPELFALLRRIKAAFDPENSLNPGKLVTAADTELQVDRIDEVPFRGERDALNNDVAYEKSVACNGNGACFHWDAASEMCPSYKATRDRLQSPKGRAALFRDWQNAKATGGPVDVTVDALAASLSTCLSCKACTSQCPVQVDIPTMKSAFLEERYLTRPRPLRDHLLRHMEQLTLLATRAPRIFNLALNLGQGIMSAAFGLTDLPRFATLGQNRRLIAAGSRLLKPGEALPQGVNADMAVVLLCDSFLGPFEPQVLESAARVLVSMGFEVFHTPILPNGKAQHVRGYLNAFNATREKALAQIQVLAELQIPLVTIEPAVTMLYRQDYGQMPEEAMFLSLDQLLVMHLDMLPKTAQTEAFTLIGHCTETSADPESLSRWRSIFATADLSLTPERAGCCGMAGQFGHERENRELSRQIFGLAWEGKLKQGVEKVLATGFSCRCQAQRFAGISVRHPVQVLDELCGSR